MGFDQYILDISKIISKLIMWDLPNVLNLQFFLGFESHTFLVKSGWFIVGFTTLPYLWWIVSSIYCRCLKQERTSSGSDGFDYHHVGRDYPLVNSHTAIENGHRNSGFSH